MTFGGVGCAHGGSSEGISIEGRAEGSARPETEGWAPELLGGISLAELGIA